MPEGRRAHAHDERAFETTFETVVDRASMDLVTRELDGARASEAAEPRRRWLRRQPTHT